MAYTAIEGAVEQEFRVAPVAATREFSWTVYNLEREGGHFGHPALCMVDGRPAMAFADDLENTLMYAYSATAHPLAASDWSVVKADIAQTTHIYRPGMAEVGGLPAIAYIVDNATQTNGVLYYCRAASPTPASRDLAPGDWISYQMDDADFDSAYPAIAEHDGTPLIVWGRGDGWLHMATTAQASPTDVNQWTNFSIYGAGTWPFAPSLGFIAGRPIVVVANLSPSSAVTLCQATTDVPASSADFMSHDQGPLSDPYFNQPRLTVAGNRPYLVYAGPGDVDLLFTYSTSSFPASTDWSQYAMYATTDGVGYACIATIDGKPALTFLTGTEGDQIFDLTFGWAAGEQPDAADNWLLQDVPDMACWRWGAFTASDGLPIVAYYAAVGEGLAIAVAQEK